MQIPKEFIKDSNCFAESGDFEIHKIDCHENPCGFSRNDGIGMDSPTPSLRQIRNDENGTILCKIPQNPSYFENHKITQLLHAINIHTKRSAENI